MTLTRTSLYSISLFLLFTLILNGCGSTPTKTAEPDLVGVNIALDEIPTLLEQADKENSPNRSRIYLDVVQALLDAEEVDWARNTLSYLSPFNVPDEQYIRYAVVSATLAVAQGQPFSAKAFLWEDRVENITQTAPKQDIINLLETRAQLLAGLNEYQGSISARLRLYELLDGGSPDGEYNQELIWQSLMELPFEDLQLESQLQESMLARGWYTLAALSKNNQTNLEQQIAEVEQWMFSWPEHPASMQLPADLRLLKQLQKDKPAQIALLLPFSGRFEAAANALRDGVMAAYYDALSREKSTPDIRIYDTANGDINEIYDTAALNGAELIIGPLEKSKITDLALRPELPVPTLALNRVDEGVPLPHGLFQFGLAVEDEARQVAEQAWLDGHRRAMIIAPSTASGDRSVSAFAEHWESLGGEITNDYRYQNQSGYSNLIKKALKIDESETRRRDIRSLLGMPIEYEPRRRKDVDFIFLNSPPKTARQMKPLLAFHYAGEIPVYALRNVYSGVTNRKLDEDLNGIRFTTLPWFFDRELPEKRAILASNTPKNYQFLYALGVDSYHLHPRLRQLMEVKQAHFYGTTGRLQLDERQQIHRKQIWAEFSSGRAKVSNNPRPNNDV